MSNTPTSDGTGKRILRVKEKKREIDVIVPPGVELVGFGDTNGDGKNEQATLHKEIRPASSMSMRTKEKSRQKLQNCRNLSKA